MPTFLFPPLYYAREAPSLSAVVFPDLHHGLPGVPWVDSSFPIQEKIRSFAIAILQECAP